MKKRKGEGYQLSVQSVEANGKVVEQMRKGNEGKKGKVKKKTAFRSKQKKRKKEKKALPSNGSSSSVIFTQDSPLFCNKDDRALIKYFSRCKSKWERR